MGPGPHGPKTQNPLLHFCFANQVVIAGLLQISLEEVDNSMARLDHNPSIKISPQTDHVPVFGHAGPLFIWFIQKPEHLNNELCQSPTKAHPVVPLTQMSH